MPAYNTTPAPALYPGDSFALSTASLPGLKSQQVYLASSTDGAQFQPTIVNGSATTATVQYALTDVDADYEPLTANGAAVTAAPTTAVSFAAGPGFYRLTFAVDPGATTVSITR